MLGLLRRGTAAGDEEGGGQEDEPGFVHGGLDSGIYDRETTMDAWREFPKKHFSS